MKEALARPSAGRTGRAEQRCRAGWRPEAGRGPGRRPSASQAGYRATSGGQLSQPRQSCCPHLCHSHHGVQALQGVMHPAGVGTRDGS